MSQENIVLLTWRDASKAYQGYSDIEKYDNVNGLAVVVRQLDGTVQVKNGDDSNVGLGTLGGSSLGALIGILGGPLGVLLGFSSGALIGSAIDLGHGTDVDGAIAEISRAVPPGATALIVDINEDDPSVINDYAARTGAVVLRKSADEVANEVASAEDAADAAAKEANKVMKTEKKAENKAKRDAKVAEIKAKIHNIFNKKAS